MSIGEAFAPLTQGVIEMLEQHNPTVYKMWVRLRQSHPPETPFNFSLKEASEEIGRSTKWLRQCLETLISEGLVEKINQSWGGIYRLIVHQPGVTPSPEPANGNKNSQFGNKTSQIDGSNPHSSVPITRSLSEIEHGVSAGQEGIWYTAQALQGEPESIQRDPQEVNPQERLFQEVLTIAPDFNHKVFLNALAQFGEDQIRKAISAIREQMEKGNVRNPAAVLLTAIRRGFTANQAKREQRDKRVEEKRPNPQDKEVLEIAIAPITPQTASGDQQVNDPQTSGDADERQWALPGPAYTPPQDERDRWRQITEQREAAFKAEVRGFRLPSPPPTEDLSGLLASISVAVSTLGWARGQKETELQKRYGVRSQGMLTSEQLQDWLSYLNSLVPK